MCRASCIVSGAAHCRSSSTNTIGRTDAAVESQSPDRREETETLGLGVGSHRFGKGDQIGELGAQPHEFAAGRTEPPRQRPRRLGRDVLAERLGERCVRDTERLVVPAEQHRGSVGPGELGELGDQPGLADAGWTVDEGHVLLAGEHRVPPLDEPFHFPVAPDEREPRVAPESTGQFGDRRCRLPMEPPGRLRPIDPLEVVLGRISEVDARVTLHQLPDEIGHQHVAGRTPVAQSCRDHHRHAEEIADVRGHLAGADTDAQQHRFVQRLVQAGQLDLDARRTPERRRDRSERRHDAVTRVLHERAAVGRDDIDLDLVDRLAQFVGPQLAQPLPLRRRPDQVGEHDHGQPPRRSIAREHATRLDRPPTGSAPGCLAPDVPRPGHDRLM